MGQLNVAMAIWGGLVMMGAPALADVAPSERQLERDFGVIVEDPERWEEGALESLYRGASTVPEALWESFEESPRVAYVERECHFSMGRYTERCPTFDEEGAFLIYEAAPLVGEGPMERLAMLNREEQRDLQLRRAMVHLAVGAADERHQWSAEPNWRAINGWPADSDRVRNRDPWGFSRYLGMRSSHLDLVTFAEEYLVRPEDLLIERAEEDDEVARRLAEVDLDQSVVCQAFSKRRALEEYFREVQPGWESWERELGQRGGGCPAFEEWARPRALQGVDLLLASAATRRGGSPFGQLLLHVRYGDEDGMASHGVEPVYHFGVVSDDGLAVAQYITRGVLGGFESVLEMDTFEGIGHRYLSDEERDLHRYRLRLSEEEARRLLERLWEGERRIRYPYLMTTYNSASFLVELIDPALEAELFDEVGVLAMPTDMLELLATAESSLGGRLLDDEPVTVPSRRRVARGAMIQRQEALERLVASLEASGGLEEARQMEALGEALGQAPAEERPALYAAVAQLEEAIGAAGESGQRAALQWLGYQMEVERFIKERARFQGQRLDASLKQPEALRSSAQEQLEWRRERYREEDLETRLRVLDQRRGQIERLSEEERGALDDEAEAILLAEEKALRAYDAGDGVQRRWLATWEGVEAPVEVEPSPREEEECCARFDERALGPSGSYRWHVGGGFRPDANQPFVHLSFARMEEPLGEPRRRGLSPEVGLTLLKLEGEVVVGEEALDDLVVEATVFDYRSLRSSIDGVDRRWRDWVGWGLHGSIEHDGRRDVWAGAVVNPTVMIPLLVGEGARSHLVLEGGPSVRYDIHRDHNFMGGAVAGLRAQWHIHGSVANRLYARAEAAGLVDGRGDGQEDLRLEGGFRHRIASRGERLMIVEPYGRALRTTRVYLEDESAPELFENWEVGLRFELPW